LGGYFWVFLLGIYINLLKHMEKKKIIEILEKRIQATRDDYHRQMERHEKDKRQVAPNSVEAASRIRAFNMVKEMLDNPSPLQDIKDYIKDINNEHPKTVLMKQWNDSMIRTFKESLELVGMLNNKHNV
jgi:vacuolar-type H+-ATPase subunit E/Vma4